MGQAKISSPIASCVLARMIIESGAMTAKDKKRCPHCGKRADWEGNPYRPFCCERCRLIDLGEWASEKYRIPGKKVGPDTVVDKKEEKKK